MTLDYSDEILNLMALQSKVPAKSWFPGDNNLRALEAQILVLRGLSIDRIPQDSWHIYKYAQQAQDWKDGKTTVPPSATWKEKVQP